MPEGGFDSAFWNALKFIFIYISLPKLIWLKCFLPSYLSTLVITNLDTRNLSNDRLKVYMPILPNISKLSFEKIDVQTFNRSLQRFLYNFRKWQLSALNVKSENKTKTVSSLIFRCPEFPWAIFYINSEIGWACVRKPGIRPIFVQDHNDFSYFKHLIRNHN